MTNLANTIAPKSDQLNADDLITGPLTVRITKVVGRGGNDQPIAIHYDGDGGKPYLPCKSMRRLLVYVWGVDGAQYVGRSMTLYRDPHVKYGGIEVGGIRISHMSDIDDDVTLALTATRSSRKPYTVKPLRQKPSAPAAPPPPPTEEPVAVVQPSEFLFTITDAKGNKTTADGELWAKTLVHLLTNKPFDVAASIWRDNEMNVSSAAQAGHEAIALRVSQSWDDRKRAANDGR